MRNLKFKIRSKKLLRGAEGQSCVSCGKQNGSTVGAHYQGIRSCQFGKGTGTKPHDLMIADLCSDCHMAFDLGEASCFKDRQIRKLDLSERFLFCICMTLIRRTQQGILYTDDIKRGDGGD